MSAHPALAGTPRNVTFFETESLVLQATFFCVLGVVLGVVLYIGCYELGFWYGGRKR